MRGNKSNHPRKWAREEDLKELKTRFYHFMDNDFRELQAQVARVEGEKLITRILLGALLSGIIALIVLAV